MRALTHLAFVAALAVSGPALAQAQQQQNQQQQKSQTQKPDAGMATDSPRFNKVEVIDFKDLPEATQTKVNDIVAKTEAKELDALRSSIDAIPQASSALKAKGLDASKVVAFSLNEGTLTLITKVG